MAKYEVRILNQSMQRLAILEDFRSLSWTRRLYQPNDFILRIPTGANGVEYLTEDNILQVLRDGDTEFTAVIEHGALPLDEKGRASEVWEERGGDVITRRQCVPPAGQSHDARSGPAETVLKGYITANVTAPTDTNRTISLVTLEADGARGGTVDIKARYEDLAKKLEETARAGNIGWELVGVANGLQFKVIPGVDRSAAQSNNPPIIFSPDFGNIKTMGYQWSMLNRATYAYVGGKGEGAARTIRGVSVGSIPTGLARRESFIDARDLELTASLDARGAAKLSEQGPKQRLEAQILPTGPFKYRAHWDLGDIVTVRNLDWGVTTHLRVTEVRVSLEPGDNEQIEVAFGAPVRGFIDVIKSELAKSDVVQRSEVPPALPSPTGSQAANKIIRATGATTQEWTSAVLIDSNGKVMIGTTTPPDAAKARIEGSLLLPSGSSYWIGNDADTGNRLRMHQNSTESYIDFATGNLSIRRGTTTTVRVNVDGSVEVGTGVNGSPRHLIKKLYRAVPNTSPLGILKLTFGAYEGCIVTVRCGGIQEGWNGFAATKTFALTTNHLQVDQVTTNSGGRYGPGTGGDPSGLITCYTLNMDAYINLASAIAQYCRYNCTIEVGGVWQTHTWYED